MTAPDELEKLKQKLDRMTRAATHLALEANKVGDLLAAAAFGAVEPIAQGKLAAQLRNAVKHARELAKGRAA